MKKRLLVIDALNLFLRNYVVNPSLSRNGDPIGGIIGSLKSLQKIARETQPNEIIIAWDGRGGSRKRRLVNKNYKDGRKPIRLNWNSEYMSDNDKLENKIYQMSQLSAYYELFPLIQVIVDDVEADDIIAFVIKQKKYENYKKIICSSDKDFIQLLNEDTILYRPAQKEILNTKRVIEKFKIHPINFALARSIAGDKSDNIVGIAGAGLPTLAKRFDFISGSHFYTVNDIVQQSQEKLNESKKPLKIYNNIVENKQIIEENYKLIQLSSPLLNYQQKSLIRDQIKNKTYGFNKTEFRRMLVMDGVGEWNWDSLIQVLNRIVRENKEKVENK